MHPPECLFYFSSIITANDEKLNLNLRLSLVSCASWVSVPDHLVLMNTGLFKLMWYPLDCLKTSSCHLTRWTRENSVELKANLSPNASTGNNFWFWVLLLICEKSCCCCGRLKWYFDQILPLDFLDVHHIKFHERIRRLPFANIFISSGTKRDIWK